MGPNKTIVTLRWWVLLYRGGKRELNFNILNYDLDKMTKRDREPNVFVFMGNEWLSGFSLPPCVFPSAAWSNRVEGSGELRECPFIKSVSLCQSRQSMWGTRRGPLDEPWWCYGTFLCTDWNTWCSLVLQPPRICQIHTPDNLKGEDNNFFFRNSPFLVQ